MTPFTLFFDDISAANHALVGGKGANLAELAQAGFNVPPGFCVTTDAFWRFIAEAPQNLYTKLEYLASDDIEQLRRVGSELRALLKQIPLPAEVAEAVVKAWLKAGKEYPYAVRSSATAEDLPFASFAGQYDTYLNMRGDEAILESIKACFISLFTDRAILYRLQNGFDHRKVALAVVVQQMVQSNVSGILFTADPVSGNRNILSIDASFGLGEALVSGLVSADLYQVDKKTRRIIKRQIASKQIAVQSLDAGGTEQIELPAEERIRPALTDARVIELARLGSQIEVHFGKPQDIEWALTDNTFHVIQSRPITSLYPLPQPQPEDDALHVYLSLSHQQGMTDAMPPLSLSLLRILLPIGHVRGQLESPTLTATGGRFYGDISPLLRTPVVRHILPKMLVHIEPLSVNALISIAARPHFKSTGERLNLLSVLTAGLPFIPKVFRSLFWEKPEGATDDAFNLIQAHLRAVQTRLDAAHGLQEKLTLVLDELEHIFIPALDWVPKMAAGIIATALLNALMKNRVDEKDLAALGRGLTGNIETEMNLIVSDLADEARTSKELLSLLGQTNLDAKTRLARAAELPGGETFLQTWNHFMTIYGARGPSEIDLSRPRWSENPSSLLQMVLNATKSGKPGMHRVHYQQLIDDAETASERIINAAGKGWLSWIRVPLVRRFIRVSRNFTQLRGYHKYLVVCTLALIKPVLLEAGKTLQHEDRLKSADDIWFLTLPEILASLDSAEDLTSIIAARHSEFEHDQSLTPPRVITSEGEIPITKLDDVDAPEGALVGSPVSAGVVEGVARVIFDPGAETLNPGEILIAPFIDPGWTPLFVNAAGLVTEVGGMMTHGSVVAREYGIPAVVGVIDATKKIKTGQHVRVYGYAGYVELLDGANSSEDSS